VKKLRSIILISLMIVFAELGCNRIGPVSGPDENTARLTVLITDAAADYDSVLIHFTHVSAHKDSEWISIQTEPKTVDLLKWSNGKTLQLGSAQVPSGHYTQIRILIDSARIGYKGNVYPMDVPSGARTGLKLGPGFTISAGADYEVVIDFNVCKSVVSTGPPGNPKRFKLKPHMRMVTRALTGSISAVVSNPQDAPLAHAIQNGDTIATSIVDTLSGYFMLGFLPGGSYNVAVDDTLDLMYTREDVDVIPGKDTKLGEITLQ
jgi:hypothetical protein